MDLFKFTHPTPTNLSMGEPIVGYDSAMWVERYVNPGEFEIVAPLSSGLKSFLPRGCIISHIDTLEVCIVEDHHIVEENDSDPTITITGSSFEAYLNNRIVGFQIASLGTSSPYDDYILASDNTWDQAVKLVNDHILSSLTNEDDEALNDEIFADTVTPGSGVVSARVIKRGSLHERLLELLAVDNLGVRMVRKNPFGGLGDDTNTYILIHNGIDVSDSVIFSWDSGELERSEYLWSLKKAKNIALVQGRYVEQIVDSADVGYNRRVMLVDASDIDGSLSAAPTGGTLTDILNKMTVRGEAALAGQKELDLVSTDISKATQYQYRKDYDIGDIVSVDGKYGDIEKRRVVEYVEIEDKTGESGHPTLAVI